MSVNRVLLVSTNTCDTPYEVYPLGMSQVAASLAGAGHAVRQFDWKGLLWDTLVRFR